MSPRTMYDKVELDDAAKVRFTNDGYLVATPRIARTGIQLYGGDECGIADKEIVRVYRPEDEVFNPAALRSFAHRPVTLDHPPEAVNAQNWKTYAVGQTGDEPLRDGSSIKIPMVLMDSAAIRAFKDGTQQLSCGYACDLEIKEGKTADGEQYDAVQQNIRANHLAIVAAARGGPSLKIGDDNQGESHMTTLKNVTVDGVTVEMSDTAAQVVQRKLAQMQDQFDAFKKKKDEDDDDMEQDSKKLKDELASKITELATKDALVTTLQSQLKDALDENRLDERVKLRADTEVAAKKIMGDGFKPVSKEAKDIRREVVKSKLGDLCKDWTDAQIEASFLSYAHTPGTMSFDAQARVLGQPQNMVLGSSAGTFNLDAARAARTQAYLDLENEQANAWMSGKRSA